MSPEVQKAETRPAAPAKTYGSLLKQVRLAIGRGKARAIAAVEAERVRTSWEIGKLILEHILLHEKRAKYDADVYQRLSRDLGLSQRELRYMTEFAREYPISRPAAKLSWGHFQALLGVNEPQARKQLMSRAVTEDWTRQELRQSIRKLRQAGGSSVSRRPVPAPAAPALKKPGVTRIIPFNGLKARDLGFHTYKMTKAVLKRQPSAGDLYYYRAEVDEVVDGDTFWARIDLGFGIWQRHRLRLRAVNAPELGTRAGIEAKTALKKALGRGRVIIRTTKSDQYGRYLADVWCGGRYVDFELMATGLFSRRG